MLIEDRIVDTKKLFIFNMHHFIRYLFGWQILPMLGLFALTFIFMPFSTLLYGFLTLLIIMMVYKLAFDVLIDTARGSMSATLRQNYLVTNAVAIKVLIIALLIELTLRWIKYKGFGDDYRLYFVIFSTFITPAIYMSLALTNSLWVALNPYNIFKVIKTTFFSYILFVIFWVLTIQLHEVVINPFLFHEIPKFINGIFSVFIEYALLILNFQIMGYIIFQNRHDFDLVDLGFEAVHDDEIVIETVITNPIYQRIQNLLADDEAQQALSIIVELQTNGDNSAELSDMYLIAMEMKLYTPTNLEIANKIHRWLLSKETKRAFDKVVEHIEGGNDYVETSPDDINQLIIYAVQINKTEPVKTLVSGFRDKYPYHADIVPNYFILAKVLYNNKSTRQQSKELLKELVKKNPQDKNISEVKAWLKGVELLMNKH
jgi:hypothetical protein